MPTINTLFRQTANFRFHCSIEVPDWGAWADRDHNAMVKEALRRTIQRHHKKVLPEHFKQSARAKYGYKPRGRKYMRMKARKFGSRRDLVKTGKSEERMKREGKITIGGAAAGGKKAVEGTLTVNFDFTQTAAWEFSQMARFRRKDPNLYSRKRAGVTIEQMKKELKMMTPDERQDFADNFLDEYTKLFHAHRSKRKRIKFRRQLI